MNSINKNTENKVGSEEISIKELFLKIKEWFEYLKAKWFVICLFGILGATSGVIYAFFKKPLYTADLTFVIEEDKGTAGGLGGALGLATTLGFDLGTSGGGIFSSANLIELMKSRSLVEKALLYPISVNNIQKSIAAYFIEFNDLNKTWKNDSKLKDIQFIANEDRSMYTLQKDSILGKIYQIITGSAGILNVIQKDKKVGIITIEVQSSNETFSKVFAESIANVVSEFYVQAKSKKAKYNYEILQKQTDSVRSELNNAINGVAAANDNTFNLNPALNIKRTTSAKRQVDVQANTAILSQLITNLEMSKVALRKETPLIQIIDKPILPLKKDKTSKLISLILGSFISVIVVVLVLIIRRTLKGVFQEE